jgi:hypothetical protein
MRVMAEFELEREGTKSRKFCIHTPTLGAVLIKNKLA